MVRLTDRPDMTLDVYGGRKTTMQQQSSRFSVSLPSHGGLVLIGKNTGKSFLLNKKILSLTS